MTQIVRHRADATDVAVLVLFVGAAFGGLGFWILAAIVYGSLPNAFGITTFLAIGCLSLSVAMLSAVVAARVARQIMPTRGLLAGMARATLVLTTAFASLWSYWLLINALTPDRIPSTLLITTPPMVAASAAVIALGMFRTRSGAAVMALVVGSALVLAWGVATVIVVNMTWSPLPVRAGQPDAHIEFDAMVSGAYDVRVGATSCGDGVAVAIGHYGPGWEETSTDIDRARVDIPRAALTSGKNPVRICLRNGFRLGQASLVIEVDDIPPTPPTLVAEPVTQDGASAVAMTRTLHFSGASEPGSQVELRLDGEEWTKPRLVGGQWSDEWQFASATEQVTIQVAALDRAGNETRSAPVTIHFAGTDSPAVFSGAFPAIAIECRGRATALTPVDCREWGAAALAAKPQLVPSIVRVVLTDDSEGCAAILVGVRELLVSYDRRTCPPGV